MTFVITGATGKLGRHVLDALLERGVPANEIVAAGRATEKLDTYAAKGVRVVSMNYDDPASVSAALKGAHKVLLIASSEVGNDRPGQHRTVIDAAKAQGVELLAYTSNANAEINNTILGQDHKATEEILQTAGVPYVLLRNGYYFENWTDQLEGTLAQGVLMGSGGTGKVNAATRRDLAEAAAAVLVEDGHAGKVYELGSDTAFTMADFAAEITAVTGTPVIYKDMPAAEYVALLTSLGIPEAFAGILADSDQGLARGDLLVAGNDLSTLIGRPATSPADAIRAALPAK